MSVSGNQFTTKNSMLLSFFTEMFIKFL